jgi:hypothetical protein
MQRGWQSRSRARKGKSMEEEMAEKKNLDDERRNLLEPH